MKQIYFYSQFLRFLVGGIFIGVIFFSYTTSVFAASIYANYSTGNDTTGDGSSGNPYKTFHKAYTSASAGDTIRLAGTFNWANSDETGDASSSGYTLGKALSIVGDSATSTIIQAAATASSAGKRVFTISTGVGTTFQNVTIRYGSGVSGAGVYINNYATTTFSGVDLSSNITSTTGDGGGMYIANAKVTIENSAIHDNAGGVAGGGIYQGAAGEETTIANSTIYYNYNTWCCNALEGGGLHIETGTTTITNVTIVKNGKKPDGTGREVYYGGGIHLTSSTNVRLYMKNSIVAENIGDGSAGAQNIYKGSSATLTNSGYNIVGKSSGFTGTTGDWVDSTNSGTFTLNTVGTTGALQLESEAALNDATTIGTKTFLVGSGSVAKNNANDTIHNGISVPTTDQRGATRSGATDIGAFEYDGGGLTIVAPATQSSSLAFSSVEYGSMTVSWTNGNGARRVLFMKAAGSGTASPVDGTVYSASTIFGSGDQIGTSGWYAVYNGNATSSSVFVTGLARATTYSFQVFEYNGVGSANTDYLTDTATNNPNTQATHTPTTIYANYSTGNDTTGDGTSGNPYKSFHKSYTTAKNLDTIYLTGTFNWANSDETGDASSSGYTLAKELTIRGVSATTTIIQAASTAESAGKRVFTMSNASTTLQNLAVRYGYLTSGSGGCISIGTGATTTITNVSVYSCLSDDTGDGGGIAITSANVTITGSAIHENGGGLAGGGVYFNAANKDLTITNSTFYNNYLTWCCNALEGGGIAVDAGTTTVTNVTLVRNGDKADGSARDTHYGGGIYLASASTVRLYLKNSIVADNTGDSSSSAQNIYKGSSATLTNSGYNIVGKSSGFTGTTGDWVDSTNSGTFTLNTVGTTGALSLASESGVNNNLTGTKTWGIGSSSVGVDGGNGSAHNSIVIPTLDQRGAARLSTVDIGAFEYGGSLTDFTAPTASSTAPTIGQTVSGASVTISADASDEVSIAGVKFYIDDGLIGIEDTSSPYSITWDSTATSTGLKSLVAVARDTSNNYATSTAVTFTVASTDTTALTVSMTTPTAGITIGGRISLTATASDAVGVSGVKFYVNDVLIGSEDTSSPYSVFFYSTTTANGAKSAIAVARDAAGNQATSSTVSFTLNNSTPSFTGHARTPVSNGATITWSSNVNASSKIAFGISTTYASSTPEQDTDSKVTSHSISLNGLPNCAFYHYGTVGANEAGEIATSTDATFATGGCTGGATISTSTLKAVTTASGGYVSHDEIALTVPTSFTGSASSVSFQSNKLDGSTFFSAAGAPSGRSAIGTNVFNLKAFTDDTTTISTFDAPLSVTFAYSASDVAGYDESTLKIYRYSSSTWSSLSSCIVNTTAKTVTCTTTNFSDFAIFGEAASGSSVSASMSVGNGPVAGGGPLRLLNDVPPRRQTIYPDGRVVYHDEVPVTVEENKKTPRSVPNLTVRTSDTLSINATRMPLFDRNLWRGLMGEDVRELQRYLNSQGFSVAEQGPGSIGQETMMYGHLTQAAVRKFQDAHDIVPSYGFFGPITRRAIVASTDL